MLRMMERNIKIQLKGEHIKEAEKLFKLTREAFAIYCRNKLEGKWIQNSVYQNTIWRRVIVCDNSFDSRVSLIFEQLLPVI